MGPRDPDTDRRIALGGYWSADIHPQWHQWSAESHSFSHTLTHPLTRTSKFYGGGGRNPWRRRRAQPLLARCVAGGNHKLITSGWPKPRFNKQLN